MLVWLALKKIKLGGKRGKMVNVLKTTADQRPILLMIILGKRLTKEHFLLVDTLRKETPERRIIVVTVKDLPSIANTFDENPQQCQFVFLEETILVHMAIAS